MFRPTLFDVGLAVIVLVILAKVILEVFGFVDRIPIPVDGNEFFDFGG